MSAEGVEIIGPFKERRLVIDGWQVPLVEATELDGGRFFLKLDGRMGLYVGAPQFENVARFIADTVAVCLGYSAHPRSDSWYEGAGLDNPFDDPSVFAHVPHPALAPRRVHEIVRAGEDG